MCARVEIRAPSMLRLIRRTGVLDEDVVNLRFDLGVESNVEETELGMCRCVRLLFLL